MPRRKPAMHMPHLEKAAPVYAEATKTLRRALDRPGAKWPVTTRDEARGELHPPDDRDTLAP